ncbi:MULTISPECIES: OmpA family protein [Sorangium]|uniref:OmpA-like domain-containing protein n=1 Tax=Sorangium cellulosum TaxID=56 RepID=A0A4P2QQV3_SORCE|nr:MULTISPECIES: OmpA family protein [Sorangium]AUX32599.1 hypothetical protein SOCE836_047420 [Sorangium cellulosum]WCQ91975.1 hypothetical protein NQZ70_04702 [Sorangium sp. Soce836]
MRRYVASVLCAVMMVGAAAATAGCTASASFNAGGKEPAATPPPPPEPKQEEPKEEKKPRPRFKLTFKLKGNQVELPGPVVFETNSDKLLPESDEVLSIVDDFLKQRKDVTLLRVEGHTDSDGEDAANQVLSEKRAMSVARWLVAKGHDCKRFIAVGFGETKPIADNNTPDGKAQNRRTGFFIAAVDGKAVDKQPVDGGGKVAGDPCK